MSKACKLTWIATSFFLGAALLTGPSQAQYVCLLFDDNGAVAGAQGATATGSSYNFACGPASDASGVNSSNTAAGSEANASGDESLNNANGNVANASGNNSSNNATGAAANASGHNSSNSATGASANASGNNSSNDAVGTGANASGDDSRNVAYGSESNASGDGSQNHASGAYSNAGGNNSRNTASGYTANASGDGSHNIALGANANAAGDHSTNIAVGASATAQNGGAAFGTGASAVHANSSAIGQGAQTVRDDQMSFGTASNTYTMAGIASSASRAAQGAPTHLVTSNADGDLAAYTFADLGLASSGDLTIINNQIASLGRQADAALAGVAMAFAMAGTPSLEHDERFAISVNLGHYEGHTATSLAAALRVNDSVQMTGGAAYSGTQNSFGGRVGVRFGW